MRQIETSPQWPPTPTTRAATAETADAPTAPAEAVGVSLRRAPVYDAAKRLLDLLLSALALLVLLPVFALIGLALKLSDGGPVFHRREVIGRNGRHFYALKFRTMIPHADEYLAAHPELLAQYAAQVKLHADPRVTRIGRFLRRASLDELPQLVNVLRGQMSLVGPRIIHPSEVERFGTFARVRQLVRPGLTGLWQVSGRQAVSYERRVELDKDYLRRRSFWLDLGILLKTVFTVIGGKGAY